MPASQALPGYGSKLSLGSTATAAAVYTEIGEVISITGPGYSTETIEVTHMQSESGFREFVVGLVDAGELSFELNYIPGGVTEQMLDELYDLPPQQQVRRWRQEFPNGVQATHLGFLTSWERTATLDDKLTSNCTIKLTGRSALAGGDSPLP